MIPRGKGIGVGFDVSLVNQYMNRGSTKFLDPAVKASLKAVVICDGKSNEDSDRAVLRNLVDKDNPFVASNFAWKLNSGYGKYETDFTEWANVHGKDTTSTKIVVNRIDDINEYGWLVSTRKETTIPSFTVRVTNLGSKRLAYYYNDGEDKAIALKDGINVLPESTGVNKVSNGFNCSKRADFIGLTIEQLPTHDGALVFDGVNDRVTSTKTMQEMVGDTNACTVVSMMSNYGTYDALVNGVWSHVNGYNIRNEIKPNDVICIAGYTDSNGTVRNINSIMGDKNDIVTIDKLNYNTTEPFTICFSSISYKIAWYWTIIANKVLTTDEIHQVIAYYNLDKHVKPDIYYDVKKQGLTNANHAMFNDKLIDYSGNGHNMQLYNIGWGDRSGIGDYPVTFNVNWIVHSGQTGVVKTATSVKVVGQTSNFYLIYHIARTAHDKFKVKVTGNKYGLRYQRFLSDGTIKTKNLDSDGIYELEASESYDSTSSAGLYLLNYELDWTGLTVEILPYNDGSLVLDGVNDYGNVSGLPVVKDYTVVGEYIKNNLEPPFVSKSEMLNAQVDRGAFVMDIGTKTYSFMYFNTVTNPNLNIRYQTKYFYNGKAITAGSVIDSDTLYLGTVRKNDNRFANLAFNFLMIFPYSLDEFLIERQLKRHKVGTLHPDLIEFRPIVKSDGKLGEVNYFLNTYSTKLYPGDYIPKGSTVLVNLVSTSEVDEFKYLKVNGKEVKFNQAIGSTNRVYTSATVVYNKAPLKIEVSLDNYIRFEDIQQPYPFVFSLVNAETDEEYAWGDKIKYGTKL